MLLPIFVAKNVALAVIDVLVGLIVGDTVGLTVEVVVGLTVGLIVGDTVEVIVGLTVGLIVCEVVEVLVTVGVLIVGVGCDGNFTINAFVSLSDTNAFVIVNADSFIELNVATKVITFGKLLIVNEPLIAYINIVVPYANP